MAEPLKDVSAAAAYYDVSPAAIYRWVEEGRLRAVRAGRLLRFRQEDLDAFLEEGQTPEVVAGRA